MGENTLIFEDHEKILDSIGLKAEVMVKVCTNTWTLDLMDAFSHASMQPYR